MTERRAADMSDDEISEELAQFDCQWDEYRCSLDESGGRSGSPGEWMIERMDELATEYNRRIDRRSR